jgi:anti-sigma B factor antagonist
LTPTELLTLRQVPAQDQRTRIIAAEGEIDLSSVWKLRHGIQRAIRGGASRLIVDLSAVDFLDGSGLRCLIDGDRAMRERGGQFAIVSDNPHLKRLFTLTDVVRHLTVAPTLSAAFSSLSLPRA